MNEQTDRNNLPPLTRAVVEAAIAYCQADDDAFDGDGYMLYEYLETAVHNYLQAEVVTDPKRVPSEPVDTIFDPEVGLLSYLRPETVRQMVRDIEEDWVGVASAARSWVRDLRDELAERGNEE